MSFQGASNSKSVEQAPKTKTANKAGKITFFISMYFEGAKVRVKREKEEGGRHYAALKTL